MEKPLREHFEVETDAGTALETFRYIDALEKYIESLGAVPVVDKPDFEKMAWDWFPNDAINAVTIREQYIKGMKRIWNDHVVPLHARVTELEEDNSELKTRNEFLLNKCSELEDYKKRREDKDREDMSYHGFKPF